MTTLRMAAGRAGVAPAVLTCALLVLGWPGAAHGRVQRADIPNRTIIGAQLETDTITAAEAARIFSVDVSVEGATATCAAGEVLAVAGGVWACTALTGLSGTVTQTSNLTVEPATFTVDWQVVDGSATAYQLRGNEAGNPVFLLIDTSAALETMTFGSAGVDSVTITTDGAGGDADLVVPTRSINAITELGIATCTTTQILAVNGAGTAWECVAAGTPGADSVTTAHIVADTITLEDVADTLASDANLDIDFDAGNDTFHIHLDENNAAAFKIENAAAADFILIDSTADAMTLGHGAATFAIASSALDLSAAGAITGATDITASGTVTGTTGGSFGTLTATGAVNLGTGDIETLGTFDGTNFLFDGSGLDDGFETTIAMPNVGVDQTISVPDQSAVDTTTAFVVSRLATNAVSAANAVWLDSNAIIAEGATANAVETTVAFADPTTSNQQWTFADSGGIASVSVMPSEFVTNAVSIADGAWGIQSGFRFEGTTADEFEADVLAEDPTVADFTVTIPNANSPAAGADTAAGFALQTGVLAIGDATAVWFDTNQIVFEGTTTADGNEFILRVNSEPGADVTLTLPTTTGTLVGTGDNGGVTTTMVTDDTLDFADFIDAPTLDADYVQNNSTFRYSQTLRDNSASVFDIAGGQNYIVIVTTDNSETMTLGDNTGGAGADVNVVKILSNAWVVDDSDDDGQLSNVTMTFEAAVANVLTFEDSGGDDFINLDTDTDAINLGNAATNPTLSQLGTGQVSFAGNVNATLGVDVTGAGLTVTAQDMDFTTSGSIQFNDYNATIETVSTGAGNSLTIRGSAAANASGLGGGAVSLTAGSGDGAGAGGTSTLRSGDAEAGGTAGVARVMTGDDADAGQADGQFLIDFGGASTDTITMTEDPDNDPDDGTDAATYAIAGGARPFIDYTLKPGDCMANSAAMATDAMAGGGITKYAWEFNDGATESILCEIPYVPDNWDTSQNIIVTLIYSSENAAAPANVNWTVYALATDAGDDMNPAGYEVTLNVADPEAGTSAQREEVSMGTITAASLDGGGFNTGDTLSIVVERTDGGADTSASATHFHGLRLQVVHDSLVTAH